MQFDELAKKAKFPFITYTLHPEKSAHGSCYAVFVVVWYRSILPESARLT